MRFDNVSTLVRLPETAPLDSVFASSTSPCAMVSVCFFLLFVWISEV